MSDSTLPSGGLGSTGQKTPRPSRIILLCHHLNKRNYFTPEPMSPWQSDSEIIQLLNGCYQAGLISPTTFQYPLTPSVYRDLVWADHLHTLDYYTAPQPEWDAIYQQRRQREHTTFTQDIVGKLTDPLLFPYLGTYHLAIVVNAPQTTVRLRPELYQNALRLLTPGGYFLADHRAKSDLLVGRNNPTRILLESAVQATTHHQYTFTRYETEPLYCGRTWCGPWCGNDPVTAPISLDQQCLYQKTRAHSEKNDVLVTTVPTVI